MKVKAYFIDQFKLLRVFYQAAFSIAVKSPANFWIASFSQIFYYIAQFSFWFAVHETDAGKSFISMTYLAGFLVTLAFVDNLYLFCLGAGSVFASQLIMRQQLEPFIFWPRSTLKVFIFSKPNFAYLPGLIVSCFTLVGFYLHYDISLTIFPVHFLSMFFGVFSLNAISYLFRLTVFWTASVVQIRNANPSFKIFVRPYPSFTPTLKIVLLTVFPALFITGIPAEIIFNESRYLLFGASLVATALLYIYVAFIWRLGLNRYAKFAT